MGILDAFGSMLGFGYRPAGERKRAADWAKLNEPGEPDAAPVLLSRKMEQLAQMNPNVWGMQDFQRDYQSTLARERQQVADAKAAGDAEQITALKNALPLYSAGMPGEGGAPITPEQSADFQSQIMRNAPAGSALEQAGLSGQQTMVNAGTAERVAGTAADQEQARSERDTQIARDAATLANSRARQNAADAELRASGKPPAGYGLVNGKLAPAVGTKPHTEIMDRVAMNNQGLAQVDEYTQLASSGDVGYFSGTKKAKAEALRSAIATQVMLAANGKSDADYAIALQRVPDLSSMTQLSSTDLATLGVLRKELAAKVTENKELFGHVPGFKGYTAPKASDVPEGFTPRKPKAATR